MTPESDEESVSHADQGQLVNDMQRAAAGFDRFAAFDCDERNGGEEPEREQKKRVIQYRRDTAQQAGILHPYSSLMNATMRSRVAASGNSPKPASRLSRM